MLALVSSASAGVLDQQQPIFGLSGSVVSDTVNDAQTFTTARSGSLDQVDLGVSRYFAGDVPLTVEIWAATNGEPAGPVLASENVPAATIPQVDPPRTFISVPLAPSVPVVAGTQYAIVLSSASCGEDNTCYGWSIFSFGSSSPYPDFLGKAFTRRNGAGWSEAMRFDFTFKTYVEPRAVRPKSKGECKKGGWKRFRNPSFKNQGQCVKFVNHHGGKAKGDEKSTGKKKGHGKKR